MNHQSRSNSCQVCCVPRDRVAGLLRNFIAALDAEPAQREPFMNYARSLAEYHLAQWAASEAPSRADIKFNPEPIGSHRDGSAQKVRTIPLNRHMKVVRGAAL